jgi:purine-binding chemotaxis protein CheW
MTALSQFVVFRLDEQRYAMSLAAVARVVPAMEITVLPNAPPLVLGIIDIEGQVLPVFNLRRRLQLLERALRPADQLVIARTSRQTVALIVDEAQMVLAVSPVEIAAVREIAPKVEPVVGVIKLPDGLVLIHDLEKFLSWDEAETLDKALNQKATHET